MRRGRSRSRPRAAGAAAPAEEDVASSKNPEEARILGALHMRKRALELASSEIQSRLEVGLQELQGEFTSKFSQLSDEIQTLFEKVGAEASKKTSQAKRETRKVFVPQDSLLSTMLEHQDENYKTIFNLFVCVLLMWGLSLALDDFSRSPPTGYHWELLTWGLWRDLEAFSKYWVVMFLLSFSVLPLAHVAAEARARGFTAVYWLSCLTYTALQLSFFAYSTFIVQSSSPNGGLFAVPLGLGFMCEQCRMSMKMHAYLREKVLSRHFGGRYACAPKSSYVVLGVSVPESDYFSGELAKYRFFHFAPTLVYRDSYPLTRRIRWSFVFFRLCEWCGIVYYAFCIFRSVLPSYSETMDVTRPLSLVQFTKNVFRCMAPAMGCMLFTHFLILHVVQNLGAELSRFADRGFYRDWWNSRTFSVFYRHWNGVVHDFIHAYMYTDLVEFCHMSKLGALLASFLLSALVHEYLLSIALGFFLPVLAVLFSGPGLLFILLTRGQTSRVWNVFMWVMLATGNAVLMVLYMREFFCRNRNEPPRDPGTGRPWAELGAWDYVVPRTYRIQTSAWSRD